MHFSILVTFLVTVTRYLTNELENEGLIWAHKLKIRSIRVGKIYDVGM